MKRRRIEERLESMDRDLANAEGYIERGVNVRSSSPLHLEDWAGKSGHPLWMKNHMVPQTKKARVKQEKVLDRIKAREHERKSPKRRSK